MLRAASIASLLLVAAAGPPAASAAGEVSFGVATGSHLFADDLELGVADADQQGAPASGVLIGVRLGVRVAPRFSLEGEMVFIPTTERMSGEPIDVLGYRGQLAADLVRIGRLRGILVAGAGVLDLAASGVPTMRDDTDLALHWGAGLGLALASSLELRLDARHLVLPDIDHSGGTSDVELTAALTYVFGLDPPAS